MAAWLRAHLDIRWPSYPADRAVGSGMQRGEFNHWRGRSVTRLRRVRLSSWLTLAATPGRYRIVVP